MKHIISKLIHRTGTTGLEQFFINIHPSIINPMPIELFSIIVPAENAYEKVLEIIEDNIR